MLLGREPGREIAELLRTHHLQFIRGREDPAPPVRALGCIVTLPGNRTVELPDAGSVEVRRIHAHPLIREERVKRREARLHERGCRLIVRQVNAVEQVCPVAGVRPDRVRETEPGNPPGNLIGFRQSEAMLFIRTRYAARSQRVDVDRQPAAAQDIRVARCAVLLAEPHLDPVCPAREQGRVHFVEGDIDAVDRAIGIERLH